MPGWKDLKRFCEHDGWKHYKQTDHYYYRKRDSDESIRFNTVSKKPGQSSGNLWKTILNRELQVTKKYF